MTESRPLVDAKTAFASLDLDFNHGFGLGEEGMSMSAGLSPGMAPRTSDSDVSASEKLMEDMAQGAVVDVNISLCNTSWPTATQRRSSSRR